MAFLTAAQQVTPVKPQRREERRKKTQDKISALFASLRLKLWGWSAATILFGHGSAFGSGNFLAGADFSHLAFFESRAVTYREAGQIKDGILILKDHGINCVRLRLFTSNATQASMDPYNYTNNLSYNLPLALRVKNAGLLFCLDFHYSDTWADPGHQATPSAWTNLTFTQLVQQMRSYNSNTIAAFAAEGAAPDYVQVGNEITGGMLWPSGKVSGSTNASWSSLGQLMKAAVQGIQDAATATGTAMPKLIVHIDRGGDWTNTMWFFDNLAFQAVPYDIIGESYYPFFHGPLTNLNTCLSNAAVRYNKPIIVAEDAFPWTNTVTSWTNKLYGYPPTIAGQVSFLAGLAKVVESVPNQLCVGVFYWSSEYQAVNGVNEAGYNTTSFFFTDGNVLPVADAIGGMAAPLLLRSHLQGNNLQLQWPFSGAASKLMASTNLFSTWLPVTNSVQIQTTGALFTVTVPAASNTAFYRLQ
jgi:arabinogalactan endo-1,4-beta-galactosidase